MSGGQRGHRGARCRDTWIYQIERSEGRQYREHDQTDEDHTEHNQSGHDGFVSSGHDKLTRVAEHRIGSLRTAHLTLFELNVVLKSAHQTAPRRLIEWMVEVFR